MGKKIIFASDLDRTLIYSEKFVKNTNKDVISVEEKEEKPLSYMTKKSIELLKRLNDKLFFIPTTTRTIAQYKRIRLFQEEIKPKYAITSNGGNILIHNEMDEEWHHIIAKKIVSNSMPLDFLMEHFNEIKGDWVLREYMGDDLFKYFIVNSDKIPHNEFRGFSAWAKEHHWNVSLQGRKMYFVPDFICKSLAIAYIAEKESCHKIFSAGDSLLDLQMLKKSNYAYAPTHGEIFLQREALELIKFDNSEIVFTEKSGLDAGEEILEKILGCDSDF